MRPILFQWGPWVIESYYATMVLGALVFYFLACWRARAFQMESRRVGTVCWVVFLAALAGARLAYVIEDWDYYAVFPEKIVRIDQGGLIFYGGLLGGIVGGMIAVRLLRLRWKETADLLAPAAVAGAVVGRFGCFLQGCCLGKVTDLRWGVAFPRESAFRYPTQLVEMGALALFFLAILWLERRHPHRPGAVFFAGILFYAVWRLGGDFLRANHSAVALGMSAFQWVLLPVITVCGWWTIRLWRSAPPGRR